MFDAETAKKIVKVYVPGATIEECVVYKSNFLIRVAHAAKEEKHFDPFYLVNSQTGEVEEFSIMTDGDLDEIAEAFGISL